MPKSDIAFASQFTPAQIDLPLLLQLVKQHEGDKAAMTEAVRAAFFSKHAGGDLKQQTELAKNPILGLKRYGLLAPDFKLTQVGLELLTLAGQEGKFYQTLARHMLLNLRGLEVLSTIRDMHAAREDIGLESISRWLSKRGLYVPPSGTHISGIKAWLKKASVLDDAYTIDEERLASVLGASAADAEALSELTKPQLAFLKALALLPDMSSYPSNKVAQYAQELYGVEFPPKSLAAAVVDPLERLGYIAKQRTTAGRGAKAHSISRTEKFRTEHILPIIETIEKSTGLKYRELFRKPFDEILSDLKSTDRGVRGKALEALAVFLMRLLDLELVAWRLRARDTTASAEVDVIVEGARFVFSRWQIQCKNTAKVALDDVAKEVGLALQLRSNVIMVVSTGTFTKDAERYASSTMASTHFQIILLGKVDLSKLVAEPTAITDLLHREARNAMLLKRPQLDILKT